jgi:hypothetical protein
VTGVSNREDHRIQYCVRPSAVRGSRGAGLALALAVLGVAACGSDERTFTAQEFVDEVEARGVTLELGRPLSTADPDTELYEVEVVRAEEGDRPEPEHGAAELGHEHSGGSLRVTEGADEAEEEFERCEAAVSLLCFRAANVVLVFEQEADPGSLAELTVALSGLESE